jgi:hypothetical protein
LQICHRNGFAMGFVLPTTEKLFNCAWDFFCMPYSNHTDFIIPKTIRDSVVVYFRGFKTITIIFLYLSGGNCSGYFAKPAIAAKISFLTFSACCTESSSIYLLAFINWFTKFLFHFISNGVIYFLLKYLTASLCKTKSPASISASAFFQFFGIIF